MYPSLGTLPILGIEIRSYQLCRWAFLPFAVALTLYLNRNRQVSPRVVVGAFLIGMPAGVIGGHLLNIFESFPFYRAHPLLIFDVLSGGSSIFGAIAVGLVAGVAYLWWQRVPVPGFLDTCAPAIALGECVTRVGCFLNGCCFGRPTLGSLGVAFPRESQVFAAQVNSGLLSASNVSSIPVHPTQLYSAFAAGLLLLLLLRLLASDRLFPGAVFSASLFGYGIQRLVVGWWRADAVLYWWEISNILSIAMMVTAAGLWIIWRGREPAPVLRQDSSYGEAVHEEPDASNECRRSSQDANPLVIHSVAR